MGADVPFLSDCCELVSSPSNILLHNLSSPDFHSEKMAKSHEELVASLKTQQKSIDDVAKMLPIIPAEIASLSEEIKSVISAVSISAEEIHDIHGNVLVLRGESDRRSPNHSL